jgi:hypothetical protein
MHIGSSERITLLEFKQGVVVPQEVHPQEVQDVGEQDQEELPECLDHKPLAYLKGKPRSILSLLCFINTNLSPLCLMH